LRLAALHGYAKKTVSFDMETQKAEAVVWNVEMRCCTSLPACI